MKKIPLTQGQFAIVDDEDYDWLMQWKWCVLKTRRSFYAVRGLSVCGKSKAMLMHTVIMQTPKGMETDHRDGDGLNNQRNNLRNCTRRQNMQNRRKFSGSSAHKGVHWHVSEKLWVARIQYNYQRIHIGRYVDEDEAGRAYDAKAKELFGEFARLNFPDE